MLPDPTTAIARLALLIALARDDTVTTFAGRVVDAHRTPIAEATVLARRAPDGAPIRAITTEDGWFEVAIARDLDAPPLVTVSFLATTADGRAGIAMEFQPTNRSSGEGGGGRVTLRDALVVTPAGRLVAEVRDGDGPVGDAEFELRDPHWTHLFATARSDADGRAEFAAAPAGEFALFATASGRGRGSVEVTIAEGATVSASVELHPFRSLTVVVRDFDSGEPIPDATIEATRSSQGSNRGAFPDFFHRELLPPRLVTDARGEVVLTELEAGSFVTLEPRARRFAALDFEVPPNLVDDHAAFRPTSGPISVDAGRVELALRRLQPVTLRWPIDPGSASIPAEGTPLTVGPLIEYQGCVGHVDHWIPGRVHDGAVEAEVEVRRGGDGKFDADDALFAGTAEAADGAIARLEASRDRPRQTSARFVRGAALTVELLDAGGSPRTEVDVMIQPELPLGADADWYAVESHHPRRAWLTTDAHGIVRFGPLVPGRFVVIADGIVRTVDLRPGDVACTLCSKALEEIVVQFTVGGERRLPSRFDCQLAAERRSARIEDPIHGDIHLFALPSANDADPLLTVRSPDHHSSRQCKIPARPASGPRVVAIDLADPAWLAEDARVERDSAQQQRAPRSEAHVDVIWKVPDGENADFLELLRSDRPETTRSHWARSWESEWPLAPRSWDSSGFDFDPADPPVISIRHPYLVGTKWNDAIDLRRPRSAITLHLEVGPLVTLEPPLPDGAPPIRGAFVAVDGAEPMPALRRGDRFVFAPPRAGTKRLLIDPIVAAPAELANVDFDGGPRDLGPVRFARGSTLRVHAQVAPPFAAPIVFASAVRIDGPAYERNSSAKERAAHPGEAVIRALGPGLFRVVLETVATGQSESFYGEVRVDGEHDAELMIAIE